MTGFKHPEYLNVMFKRETGSSPGEYRRSVTLPGSLQPDGALTSLARAAATLGGGGEPRP